MSLGGAQTGGSYGVVTPRPRGRLSTTPEGASSPGQARSRRLVDVESLPAEYREAIEADDFVLYGKASVEQYDKDTPSQKLTMEALDEALPQLFETGIISRRHKDVPVGTIEKAYTLEEPSTFQVGDESRSFDAGETLKTGVAGDSFWIVANLHNNTEIAKETRLKALSGDLDGFSVTIFAKDVEPTQKGEKVTGLDWHSVTIGTGDQIKNPAARFGVAEYKLFAEPQEYVSAALGEAVSSSLDEAWSTPTRSGGDGPISKLAHDTMSDAFWQDIYEKAGKELGLSEEELKRQKDSEDAHEEGGGSTEGGNANEEDADPSDIGADVAGKSEDEASDGPEEAKADDGDVQRALMLIEQELGPEARAAVEDILGAAPEGPPAEDAGAPPAPEDEGPPEPGMKSDDQGDYVTEDQLNEKLETLKADLVTDEDLNSLREDTKAAVTDAIPDAVEGVAEKMATGETPNPASGSTHDATDYSQDIAARFGADGATSGGDEQ